ncbi:Uncharacterised protein [uncultured archaeon]|nr:Uncharacterised protein [uncultured archaeon]
MTTSGWIPIPCSKRVACCVGFVFCSPTAESVGTKVSCMNITLPGLSRDSSLMASMKYAFSRSPAVPPTSTSTTSESYSFPTFLTHFLISPVRWGTICTSTPR